MPRFFSKHVKRALHARASSIDGVARCERLYGCGCGAPLVPRKYVYDHIIRYELSRDSSFENGQILCDACNAAKTFMGDIPAAAKSKRVHDRHIDATPPPRHPMACGRNSKRSRTLAGRVVERLTQGQKLARTRKRLGGVYLQGGEP